MASSSSSVIGPFPIHAFFVFLPYVLQFVLLLFGPVEGSYWWWWRPLIVFLIILQVRNRQSATFLHTTVVFHLPSAGFRALVPAPRLQTGLLRAGGAPRGQLVRAAGLPPAPGTLLLGSPDRVRALRRSHEQAGRKGLPGGRHRFFRWVYYGLVDET